ncbi:MAG: hypothetical protein Q9201_000282 [Fulgogasparrea decipioides]
MSAAGEERWRSLRGQQNNAPDQNSNPNQARHHNQQRQSSSRESATGRKLQSALDPREQRFTAMSGNAWVNNDRSGRDAPQYGPGQEQHVPLNGFNTQDVRDTLRTAFNSVNRKVAGYKTPNQAQGTKPGAPWASRPNNMGSGRDFFLELRKQLSAIQQHGPERAGG